MRWRISWFQFSLSKLFVLVTLCAIGIWYWYQRPYPVEKMVESLDGARHAGRRTSDPQPPASFRELQYVRRVWGGGTVKHGPYRGYDLQGKLLRSGNYRNGQRHGHFVTIQRDGSKHSGMIIRDLVEGEMRSWDAKGNLIGAHNFLNGKRHGLSRSWGIWGNLSEEENYESDVLHGPFVYCQSPGSHRLVEGRFEHGVASGAWKWFPRKNSDSVIMGQWRKGRADGRWEWLNANGERYIVAEFSDGQIVQLEPRGFSPRILEEVAGRTRYDPRKLALAFMPPGEHYTDTTWEDLIKQAYFEMDSYTELDLSGLEKAALKETQSVDINAVEQPWLLALRESLKPYGLGYDLRYNTFCIDTIDSIEAWQDTTLVTAIIPPLDSELEVEWAQACWLEVVEMPFRDVLSYLAEGRQIRFDTRFLKEAAATNETEATLDTPVTITIERASLKNSLAILLRRLNCKAWLQGETIVVSAQ
jgi:hypothetical protein